MSDLRFYPKLYVGVKGKRSFNKEDPPLSFATQVGTDAEWTKRKKTVDDWAGYTRRGTYVYNPETRTSDYVSPPEQTEEGFYIDNEPMSGFYFEKSVTRWRTSNKWFAINDPRGFQLQITAENLGEILLNSHITKGMLVGKFVWAKKGQYVYLCREDHPDYVDNLNSDKVKKSKSSVKLTPGDRVILPYNGTIDNPSIYLGKKYLVGVRNISVYRNIHTRNIETVSSNWNYRRQRLNAEITHDIVHEVICTKFMGPINVFAYTPNKYKDNINIYAQKNISIAKIVETGEVPVLENKFYSTYMSFHNRDYRNTLVFDTRDEAMNFVLDQARAEEFIKSNIASDWIRQYNRDYGWNYTDEVINIIHADG